MSSFHELWDCSFRERSPERWHSLFELVKDSFSSFVEHNVILGEVDLDDEVGARHSGIGASVEIPLVTSIDLRLVGSLGISVNRREAVSVRALLLLFCNDQRLAIHPSTRSPIHDWYCINLDRNDEFMTSWKVKECMDESGEWEIYKTLKDWRTVVG
ncbi:MAG: hypothetical protein AAF456_25155 [Planctomycetota bacterium]